MIIRAIIANATAAFSRFAGFAHQAAGIDAGCVWCLAPVMPVQGKLWPKHLSVSVAHKRDRVCARGLNRTQTGNYSMGVYVWGERKGGGHAG